MVRNKKEQELEERTTFPKQAVVDSTVTSSVQIE